jgi:hypothetical protein
MEGNITTEKQGGTKLDMVQRARANALIEQIIEDPEKFAFEIVALQARIRELERTYVVPFGDGSHRKQRHQQQEKEQQKEKNNDNG